jgi:hypothetical protein
VELWVDWRADAEVGLACNSSVSYPICLYVVTGRNRTSGFEVYLIGGDEPLSLVAVAQTEVGLFGFITLLIASVTRDGEAFNGGLGDGVF